MIKACIFDMDGTVANTINSIKYFANNALKKAGLDEIDTETYKVIVGNGAKVLVERMLKTVGADEKYFDEVSFEYNTKYDNDFLYLTEPYEGIIDMLKELKKLGIKTAILSNKPHGTAIKVSEALFPEGLIDICLYENSLFLQELSGFKLLDLKSEKVYSTEFIANEFKMIPIDNDTLVICNEYYAKFIEFKK